MMRSLWSLVLLACLLVTGQGQYLSRCEVAQQLQELGMDGYAGYSLANWVCTAFYESSYNTQALHFENDGSVDFGIFQINSRYWCQYGNELSANECGIQCSDLLSSNLAADAACAKLVVLNSWNGMGAWVSWRLYCQGQDLSRFVEGCGV